MSECIGFANGCHCTGCMGAAELVDLERLISDIEEWRKRRARDVSSPTRNLMMRCHAFLIESRAAARVPREPTEAMLDIGIAHFRER